jgi:hypothetical protein
VFGVKKKVGLRRKTGTDDFLQRSRACRLQRSPGSPRDRTFQNGTGKAGFFTGAS